MNKLPSFRKLLLSPAGPAVLGSVAAVLWVAACANLFDVPDTPGVEGMVRVKSDTLFHAEDPDRIAAILVREDGEECGTIYGIRATTRIGFARSDGLGEPASLDDVEVGARVRVWANTVCQLSCPGVCGAGWLLILDRD